jgi:hypothetical protein
MMRSLLAAARAVVLALLCIAPASAAGPLAGTWSSTLDWENQQAGLYSVLAIGADGHIRVHVMNHMGMAYDLLGSYRMDATGRTMRFTWTDYSPKRICVGGNCTPMGPPQRLGVAHTSRIQFQNPNSFIGTTEDGASTNWIRMR